MLKCEFLEIIARFLVSIAFRDCSIMLNLHRFGDGCDDNIAKILTENLGCQRIELGGGNVSFYVKSGLIDFKMKSYDHIEKFIE